MTLAPAEGSASGRHGPVGEQLDSQRSALDLVLAHFLRGEELAAEFAARLAGESDYALAEVYDTLRAGVYGGRAIGSQANGDAEALHTSLLDDRLVRLAARLQTPPRRHRDPQAMVLTTVRRGVAASICHLFAIQGVPMLSLGLADLGRHRRGGAGIGRQFSVVRYVVVDGAGATADELQHLVGMLRQLHLMGDPFTVLVLGDSEVAVKAATRETSGALTFVSSLAELMEAAGLTSASPLTPRERAVLEFVAEGATNQQAATALGISLATVKTYLERAQVKLKSCDRASAVATALRRGWI
jgi:DNA-binding CsgD family transcriptional regulator